MVASIPPQPARLTTLTLASGDGFEVVRTRWRRSEHPDKADAALPHAAFEFMLSGCYRKRVGSRRIVGDVNTVVYFQPDERFAVEHPFGDENHGVTIRLNRRRYEESIEESHVGRKRRSAVASQGTHAVTSTRLHMRLRRLLRDLESGETIELLEIDERVLRIVRDSLNGDEAPEVSACADRHVESAREFLDQHFAQRITLDDLSRATGISSCRISRVFSHCVGVPVHRYLKRLRLREACTRLADGATDLTRLALDMGFCSHSHFTAAFRREFGASPRKFHEGNRWLPGC